MITVPTIPTDSLYKFLFVASIILFVTSAFLLVESKNLKSLSAIEEAKVQGMLQLDSLVMEREYLKDSLGGSIIISMEEVRNGNAKGEVIFKKIDTAFLNQINANFDKKFDQLLLSEKAENYKEMARLALLFAAGLMFIGGVGWYGQIQKHQDRLIAIQVQTAEIELSKLKASLNQPALVTPEPDVKQLPERTENDKPA